jgi:hypothetical protein
MSPAQYNKKIKLETEKFAKRHKLEFEDVDAFVQWLEVFVWKEVKLNIIESIKKI